MNPVAYALLLAGKLISSLISLYCLLLVVYLVLNILIQLGILNGYKPLFKGWSLSRMLGGMYRWFEPPLRKIRQFVPPFGALDFSPIVLIFLLQIASYTVLWLTALLVGVVS